MELKHDKLLSNVAFKFNLRHYSKEDPGPPAKFIKDKTRTFKTKVGRCR